MKPDYKVFQLDKKTPSKEFLFKYPFSIISIKRVIFDSLFGLEPQAWFTELSKYGYSLRITCSRTDGVLSTDFINFIAYVSPNHKHPVWEFENNLLIPDENYNNSSITIFCNYCKIELVARTLDQELNDSIKISIIYDNTPGAESKNPQHGE